MAKSKPKTLPRSIDQLTRDDPDFDLYRVLVNGHEVPSAIVQSARTAPEGEYGAVEVLYPANMDRGAYSETKTGVVVIELKSPGKLMDELIAGASDAK